ncbi:glycoside hydrolase family 13 protein [Wolfiporia cocos MD-104 SS10]|uniref:Glycoside hydrolase family 13 protein n=1 Tax=Wolfiporia cocos (strain MD-104) TaxID=742152 RepID=A0A2H3JMR1_WOLCO|nr:glycoside hydrolase family 13 protein [Wolfiporia cocos MD-104 SS10]
MDTDDDAIVDFFNNWIHNLVIKYGTDSIWIDTMRNIRKDFWLAFVVAANVFSIGEVLDGDMNYVSPYTRVMDSVLDYPTYYPLYRAFNTTSGNLSELADTVKAVQSSYRLGEFMTTSFLKNQDNPRFQSTQTDQAMRDTSSSDSKDLTRTLRAAREECDNLALHPGWHPDTVLWSRAGVHRGQRSVQPRGPLAIWIRGGQAACHARPPSSQYLNTSLKFRFVSQNTLVISKPPMLTLLTNGGSVSTPSWSIPDVGYVGGSELIDVLSCDTMKAD